MSYAARIRRLASRVSESRRPKRLAAATRLARDAAPSAPATPEPSALPAVRPLASPARSASSLPVSEQATRWLTHGEAPADLVPLLGEPTLPPRPASDPEQRSTPQPASGRQVLARILEGGQLPSATPATEHDRLDAETPIAAAGTAIQEIPGVHGQSPPMMRLARTPQQASSAPRQPSPRELALLSGGELSEQEPDTSSVLFRSPDGPAPSPAGPPATPRAAPPPSSSIDQATGAPIAAAKRSASPCDAGSDAGASRRSEAELDELYEALLQRLRRDLIHDRERLGDLLGPLR